MLTGFTVERPIAAIMQSIMAFLCLGYAAWGLWRAEVDERKTLADSSPEWGFGVARVLRRVRRGVGHGLAPAAADDPTVLPADARAWHDRITSAGLRLVVGELRNEPRVPAYAASIIDPSYPMPAGRPFVRAAALAPSRSLFRNGDNRSIGNGKRMVEFLSAATSASA